MTESGDANIDPELQYPHASAVPQHSPPTASGVIHPYYLPQQSAGDVALRHAVHHNDRSPSPDDDDDGGLHDHDDQDALQGGSGQGLDANGLPRRSRACDNCRRDKQKCEPSEDPSDLVCKRCKRGNKNCFVTPSTKKRQKKENNAVSKLQEEVAALKAMIHGMHTTPPSRSPSNFPTPIPPYEATMRGIGLGVANAYASPSAESITHSHNNTAGPSPSLWSATSEAPTEITELAGHKRRRESDDVGGPTIRTLPVPERPTSDPSRLLPQRRRIDHSDLLVKLDQIVTKDAYEFIFKRYVQDISTLFPIVPLPPGTTASQLRSTKPLLFLSIIACCSFAVPNHIVSPEAQSRLGKLFVDQAADYVWRNAEKSFEIIQALQVGVHWYRPATFEQHNFYNMANTATSMALDLGSGKRASSNILKMGIGPFRKRSPDADSLDGRRAFLACYYMGMNMTMLLRRPILLHWSRYMDDCIEYIETNSTVFPTDRDLCYHVKLARIAEDIVKEFKLEDPSELVSLAEPLVIQSLRGFRVRLEALMAKRPPCKDPSIFILTEQIIMLYLHEIALHPTSNDDDSKSQSNGEMESEGIAKFETPQISGTTHIDALTKCLSTCHGILDTFLAMPFENRLVIPVIFSVRTIYGVVCLIKFWGAVTSPGHISQLFTAEELRVEYYLERLVETFRAIVDRFPQAPHGKFYSVASSLKERFRSIKEGVGRNPDGSIQFPCQGPPSREELANSTMPTHGQNVGGSQQTPLHLLSEVAMGNSSQPQQQQPQQLQAYPQQPHQHPHQQQSQNQYIDPAFNMPDQPFPTSDYDFSLIDFNSLGMLNTDLSGLFMWDPNNLNYIGGMGQSLGL